jgi:hypothetical protein
MIIWPPAETPVFIVSSDGVRPVLFSRPRAMGFVEVHSSRRRRRLDRATGQRENVWHTFRELVVADCVFGCRETAEFEFARRQSQRAAAAAAWPGGETSGFLVDARGVEPVLVRQRLPGDLCRISRRHGSRAFDRETWRLVRQWSESTLIVPIGDVFATEAAARAVFSARRQAKREAA